MKNQEQQVQSDATTYAERWRPAGWRGGVPRRHLGGRGKSSRVPRRRGHFGCGQCRLPPEQPALPQSFRTRSNNCSGVASNVLAMFSA